MGSKVSRARRPTPANTVTASHPTPANTATTTVPKLPQEIIEEILDHLAAGHSPHAVNPSLRSCSLVSKSWVPPCRRHLFHTVAFITSKHMEGWLEAFPVPEESPAHRVRDLSVWIGGRYCVPEEEFFEYTPWFTNVKKISLLGHHGNFSPLRTPSLWRLPRSATSLTIGTNVFTLVDIRDIMVQLPNLDDLRLYGSVAGRGVPLGIGIALRGRFGGRLQLADGPSNEDVINMLLEIPTGLHFTEVQISWAYKSLLSTLRLTGACGKNLVKLLYSAFAYDQVEPSERSFDFSKLPNIQRVDFGVHWASGDILWIPIALSTLRPTTSPRIFDIRLNFSLRSTTNRSVETLLNDAGRGLRLVADEFARIKREFGGAVYLSVGRDPTFGVALRTLNILPPY